jgi:GTP-binding protein
MSKPIIAIVGRPNVGKSTLFNRITRTRSAIVEDVPGVTRDRIYQEAEWDEREFVVIDTGGLFSGTEDDIHLQTKNQALFAIDDADLVVALFDGRDGLVDGDREIVRILRPISKRVIYAVNKIDAPSREDRLVDFYSLGVDELIPLSAATGYGFQEFMERVIERLPEKYVSGKEEKRLPRIAIVGKPNVGKSTLVNSLLGKERMIVSPEPGTTRDSVDSICRYYRREYVIIDTAGLRRRSRITLPVEQYMFLRAARSIERSDVALLLIDADEGVSDQDKKIAGLIERYGKGMVLLFNKWDLVEEPERRYEQLIKEISWKLFFLPYAPVLTTSGLSRKRITRIFPLVDQIIKERRKRITTSELNRFASELAISLQTYRGKKVKVYYMTQTGIEPPTFVLFVNFSSAFKPEQIRYVERMLRERYSFKGTPVRIHIRERV